MNETANSQPHYGDAQGQQNRYLGDQAKVSTPKQPEIPHGFDRLEKMLASCGQGIDQLAARLEGSVMRSEAPSPSTDRAPQAIAMTKTGGRLQDITSMVTTLNERIHSISARLEV